MALFVAFSCPSWRNVWNYNKNNNKKLHFKSTRRENRRKLEQNILERHTDAQTDRQNKDQTHKADQKPQNQKQTHKYQRGVDVLTDLEPILRVLQGTIAGDPTAATTCLGESSTMWGPGSGVGEAMGTGIGTLRSFRRGSMRTLVSTGEGLSGTGGKWWPWKVNERIKEESLVNRRIRARKVGAYACVLVRIYILARVEVF